MRTALRNFRKSLWLTQEEMAEKIGVKRGNYNLYESGKIKKSWVTKALSFIWYNDAESLESIYFTIIDSRSEARICIPIQEWKAYYDDSVKRYIEQEKTGDYTNIYDIDECQELGKMSMQHLIFFLSYKQKNL